MYGNLFYKMFRNFIFISNNLIIILGTDYDG